MKTTDWKKEERDKKKKIVKDFKFKLEPEPKQYITDVFRFYLHNKDEIGELKNKDRKRLLFLAYEDGVKRLNPQEFTVTIEKYTEGKRFRWTRQAEFYGDMVRVVENLDKGLLANCKQHLIDFIPFSLSDDLTTIIDLVENVTEEEIDYLNQVFSDRDNDKRYLATSSYIYFVQHFKKNGCDLHTPKTVLLSFIGDEKISLYDQKSALEALQLFIDKEDKEEFELLKNLEKNDDPELSREANEILIKKYLDAESINWRFSEIKKLAKQIKPKQVGIAHSVEYPENEYMDKSFAWPLVEIADVSLTDRFLELLSFADGYSRLENSA